MPVRPQNLVRLALATTLLLLVPLVAMQFTPEVNWTPLDFLVAGTLLFGTGLAYEWVASRGQTTTYRLGLGLALLTALLLVWVNAAVGIIGSEQHPANLLFGGVLAVGLAGAGLARLQPLGMARTMVAAAFAQLLVPVLALLIWRPELTPDVTRGLAASLLFVALWGGAAWLFRRAGAGWSAAGAAASGAA